jgi:hypothetical protein
VRGGVADGGGRAEVAADRGAVADERRCEHREQLGQQRDPAVEAPLHLGERERGADLDARFADLERAELGQALDRDRERCRGEPRRFTSTPQSVVPAATTASGSSRSSPSASSSDGRTHEPLAVVARRRGDRRGSGSSGARRGVGRLGIPEREGRVADRAVSRAAAQVAR